MDRPTLHAFYLVTCIEHAWSSSRISEHSLIDATIHYSKSLLLRENCDINLCKRGCLTDLKEVTVLELA